LQELWRIETKNGIVEKMFVEEKDVNEIKKIEEKTLNLRNKMIDEQNDPEYVEKKIKEI
jgi:DNA-directed RNA polymerase sigma subunit (sigma70/sigma32)